MIPDTPPGRGWRDLQAHIAQWPSSSDATYQVIATQASRRARVVPSPYYRDLLTLSGILIGEREGRPELAVIVAQMACEVVVEQTLTPLLKGRKEPQTFDVAKNYVRSVYTKLTHDKIEKQPFWTPYKRHVGRRHKVVHRSGRVGQTEAQDSLAAVTAFVNHVENVRRSTEQKGGGR